MGPPRRGLVLTYAWFILKNVLGWTLMLAAWPIGLLIPGPGGIPLFLIGFALVTFPGKRRLTARVLRGKPLNLDHIRFTWIAALLALAMPLLLYWVLIPRYLAAEHLAQWGAWATAGACLLVMAMTWLLARFGFRLLNVLLRIIARVRRKTRPWLRDHGIRLLPPRVRRRPHATGRGDEDEILVFHERHHRRLRAGWVRAKPWLKRIGGFGLAVAIFWWFGLRIHGHWSDIQGAVHRTSLLRLAIAAGMFATFLFVFRALSWRWILIGLGHRLPVAPATRIWSTSELARYVPGVIWQVVGRVYLCRPYGISGTICSTSQVLELAIFLLANILVAASCLLWFGWKMDPRARPYLMAAMSLLPVLLVLLHPRIFYGITNALLRKLGKPAIITRLSGRAMIGLVAWAVLGLLWQSLALWLITAGPLGLKLAWWWMVAGAYCLAWCAGFLAILSPGGIGVREFVFVMTMLVVLPLPVRENFIDPRALKAFLAFLSILLRLWATTGELILSALAYAADYRGALGRHRPAGHDKITTASPAASGRGD
jgi:hypothetical protein